MPVLGLPASGPLPLSAETYKDEHVMNFSVQTLCTLMLLLLLLLISLVSWKVYVRVCEGE